MALLRKWSEYYFYFYYWHNLNNSLTKEMKQILFFLIIFLLLIPFLVEFIIICLNKWMPFLFMKKTPTAKQIFNNSVKKKFSWIGSQKPDIYMTSGEYQA